MEKLKGRLDAFADAVIAIIITVMVLELPIEITNGQLDYAVFFKSIGIYAVSFCFVANLWYQHAVIFNEVESVENKTIIWDLIFLFFFSLFPTFTKLMTSDTIRVTVIMYGVLSLIILAIFRQYIVHDIIHQKYTEKSDMARVYQTIYGNNANWVAWLNVILIGVAFFFPRIAAGLYIAIPISSFFTNFQDNQTFNEVQQLDHDQRQDFIGLSARDRSQFSKLARQFLQTAQTGNQDDKRTAWQQFSDQAKNQFHMDDAQVGKFYQQLTNQWNERQQAARNGHRNTEKARQAQHEARNDARFLKEVIDYQQDLTRADGDRKKEDEAWADFTHETAHHLNMSEAETRTKYNQLMGTEVKKEPEE